MPYIDLFPTLRSQRLWRVFSDSSPFWTVLDALDPISPCYRFAPTEGDTAYAVAIELAGYKREHVTVEVDDKNRLVVYASRPTGPLKGIEMGTSVPSILIPSDADSTKVTAKLEDGLLTVLVPKVAAPAPRKVVVT